MKKEYRIKKNKEFQLVFQNGKSTANRQFVIYSLPKQNQEFFRIGLSVSKRIGNAVTRNRIKRLIRQVFLEEKNNLLHEMDYVVIARKPCADMDYFEVKNSLLHVFKIAKILKGNKILKK